MSSGTGTTLGLSWNYLDEMIDDTGEPSIKFRKQKTSVNHGAVESTLETSPPAKTYTAERCRPIRANSGPDDDWDAS
jgi:hypothetical protein